MTQYYRRMCLGVNDKGKMIPLGESVYNHGAKKKDPFKDVYLSYCMYDQTQYDEFVKTKSIAGVFNVVTDRLIFDFDSKTDVNLAHKDAIEVVNRLLNLGFNESNIRISWSGNKGFHVEIKLTELLIPEEIKNIARTIAKDLKTLDDVIYNASRLIRELGSIHKISGLYKIPLTIQDLNRPLDAILEDAKDFPDVEGCESYYTLASLPQTVRDMKKIEIAKPKVAIMNDIIDIDFTKKVKGWSNCKWALTQGVEVKESDRHSKLVCIAATARSLNNTSEQAYYLAKNAMKMGVKRYGGEECDKEDIGLIVDSVYAASWLGGTMSCRDGKTPWLTSLCESLGAGKCKHNEDEGCFIEIDDFASKFTNFATNIQQNTLKLGVPPIDDNVMLTTSMLVGLLGAPSSGKSTLMFNFLEQSNKDNIDSVFFSMDMSLPLVYMRLIQKHFGLYKDQVFDMFMNDPKKVAEIVETIKEKYKHTKFSFKTGLTVEGMKNAVLDHQDKTGRKVKMMGVDYLECVAGQFSDANANSALISNQLKDVANDLDICVMLLLQTQKQSGDPSDPLLSMRNVKGSSVTEQACSVILSLSRPGFSPTSPENDRFVTISSVKDRMGSLVSKDCGWDGLRGNFYPLSDEDRRVLDGIRANKAKEKQDKNNSGW